MTDGEFTVSGGFWGGVPLTVVPPTPAAELWVRCYPGPGNGDDLARAIAVDGRSNVYVTGSSVGTGSGADYLTIGYRSDGEPLWTNRYNGPASWDDRAWAVAVDRRNQVYVTGGAVDSGPISTYTTIGYGDDGTGLWTNWYAGPDGWGAEACALAVDGSNRVYVTGYSPCSAGTCYATLNYASQGGGLAWAAIYDQPGNFEDLARAVAVDGNGRVYVTGYSDNGNGYDLATVGYGSNGVALWTNRCRGPSNQAERAQPMAVDADNNVLVTGTSEGGWVTLKYSSDGESLWTNRYRGPGPYGDFASAVAVDRSNNVYVTGSSHASLGNDYLTIKYQGNGTPVWTNSYNGPAGADDSASALAVDGWGNVYVSGWSLETNGYYDFATIGYSSDGRPLWTNRYDRPAHGLDYAQAIAVDGDGEVYVTGYSWNGANYDYATVKYAGGAAFPTGPLVITYTMLAEGGLVYGGTGGTAGGTYYVVASTNVAKPMANWERVATNTFAAGGTFSVTNALDPARPRQFFRLSLP
jgi:hypothetical protein